MGMIDLIIDHVIELNLQLYFPLQRLKVWVMSHGLKPQPSNNMAGFSSMACLHPETMEGPIMSYLLNIN